MKYNDVVTICGHSGMPSENRSKDELQEELRGSKEGRKEERRVRHTALYRMRKAGLSGDHPYGGLIGKQGAPGVQKSRTI